MTTPQRAVDWIVEKFTSLKERVLGSHTEPAPAGAVDPEVITNGHADGENDENIVESMLAEVPQLSGEAKDRIRERFPAGNVCCPIKVARAIQLELLKENPQGEIKFTA